MKEKALFLLVLGYILSFLAIKDIFFLILNIVILIILIIKKKNYKFYLIGVLFLCLRLIFINNNYNLDVNEKFLVVLNKENYSIIMNGKLQQFVCYDLVDVNDYSIIKIDGYLIELYDNSNFDIFSFKEYLSYRNIKFEIKVSGLEIISKGDTFKPKIMDFLLKGLDENNKNMVNLILFGQKEDSSLYNDLIKVGVVHLVVVSGFHFNALEQLFNKIKIKYIKYIMIFFFLFYLYLLGFQIAAFRAFLSILLKLLSKKYKILNNFFNFLIILGSFLIINPFYLFHTGFVLSFSLTFVLIFTKEISINKYLKSFIVYLCALPIIISMNNEFHILSFIFQYILTFPITLLYFSSWIVLILKFLSPIYSVFCTIFVGMIDILSYLPSMIICKHFNYLEVIIFYGIILLIIYLLAIRLKRKIPIFICLISMLFIYKYNYSFIYEKESVVFFDVGQGDCTLINLGHNKGHVLIDTGGNVNYDYALKVIIPYLKANGIRKLDYVLITHQDYDHYGALESLVNNYKVENILYGKDISELNYKGFQITNLNYGNKYLEDNEQSGVFYFSLFETNFLIMGDASINVERDIIDKYSLDIDYLRVGHHGSNTSSSYEFLKSINCENAIISVGKSNNYGHPHQEVLSNLEKLNYNVYRTDLHGMIIVTSNRIKTRFDV